MRRSQPGAAAEGGHTSTMDGRFPPRSTGVGVRSRTRGRRGRCAGSLPRWNRRGLLGVGRSCPGRIMSRSGLAPGVLDEIADGGVGHRQHRDVAFQCWTPMTIASTIRALTGPWVTTATRTATVPDSVAAMTGMNAPGNTRAANGKPSGTRRMASHADADRVYERDEDRRPGRPTGWPGTYRPPRERDSAWTRGTRMP